MIASVVVEKCARTILFTRNDGKAFRVETGTTRRMPSAEVSRRVKRAIAYARRLDRNIDTGEPMDRVGFIP
jgi:hypothetical protein